MCVPRVVISGEGCLLEPVWGPQCVESCKPWEADLYPVTCSPNEEAGGVYLITLKLH